MNDGTAEDVLQVEGAKEAEVLAALKDAVETIRTTIADDVADRRATARETLLCEWEGQSEDGRKHAEDKGEDALPFEGASDNRVRLTDKIAKEHARQLVAAAMRATTFVGTESNDNSAAGRIGTLVKWLVRNQWGAQWRRTVELLAWWQETDTPAGAIAQVDWMREVGIRPRKLAPEDVIAGHLASLQTDTYRPTPDDAAEIAQVVYNPIRQPDLATVLRNLFPDLKPARAERAAREIQEKGQTTIPEKYARTNMPQVRPMRLYYDIFFRPNTVDLQRAPEIIVRDLLNKAEVLERAATLGWSDKFVEGLVGTAGQGGHEAESAFDVNADGERVIRDTGETSPFDGLYEVLTAYRKVADEDGGIGIHITTFSAFVDVAAKKSELFDRDHGKYPFIYFPREVMSDRLIDSRGVPEVYQTDQQGLKLLKDSFEDHVQVATNPPTTGGDGGPRAAVAYSPFGHVPSRLRQEVRFLERAPYPQAARDYWAEMRREINETDGRPGAEVDPLLVQLAVQDRIDRFLASLSDVLMMVVQLCQQFMTDEQVQRVVGAGGVQIARSVEEIQGKYDIQLAFDARDMDMELVVKKAEVILKNIKPLDVRAVLPYQRIVATLLAGVDPNLADMVATVEQADAREIAAERAAFVSMLNGVEPEMPDGGINAPLRLQTLQQLINERQSNPAAYPPVSPISAAMVENRIKYLTFQSQQMENADIGRVGTEPVDARDVRPTGTSPVGAEERP